MRYPVLLLLPVLLLAACTTTDSVRVDGTSRYAPSETVSILNQPPQREYEVVALLESRGSVGQSLPNLLASMRQEAREMGADAIIPMEERSEYQEPGFMYNSLIGGYQSLPGGRVPILRGYAIIYDSNKQRRALAYRRPSVSGGIAPNAVPFALSGYGGRAWIGKDRFRGVVGFYSLDTPQAFLRDGFTAGKVEAAYRATGNYFFLDDLSGPYFTLGMEYAQFSAGFENSLDRGEWEDLAATTGIGYLLPLGRYFHLDAALAINARLVGEEEVMVGNQVLIPDEVSPALFIGFGVNF